MRWLAVLVLAVLPAAAQEEPTSGLDMMATEADEGFAEVRPDTEIRFPEDHGPHPAFRIEWWYVTANLEAADGTAMGAQWTLFRFATKPPAEETGWEVPQIWMGHAALTSAQTHRHAERFARGGIGQAGARAQPFEAWIDDWGFVSEGATFTPARLTARGEGFSYDLRLFAEGPMVLQGEAGYSVKSERGQASHYASQPFFRVEGTVSLGGAEQAVTGRAWMDREWSSEPLAEGQTGWDWFSLHLATGEKVMVYGLRDEVRGPYITGNWITPDGSSTRLAPGEIAMTPLVWTEVAGDRFATEWRIEIPGRGLDVRSRPLNARALNDLSTRYWEGPVSVSGSHEGIGYLEMTAE